MPRTFTYNGTAYPVVDLKVTSRKNDFDFFSCRLMGPSTSGRTAIGQGGHLLGSHEVVITESSGGTIFGGFLESVREDGLDLILEGRDYQVLLLDERTPRDLEYINQTGSTIVNGLLGYSTKIVAGTITYSETISGTIVFSHENLLRGVSAACKPEGKDFWVQKDAGVLKLYIGTRGSGSEGSPTATYYTGNEIGITSKERPTRDIVNRQRVFGYGDGINQIQVCVPYLNADVGMPDTDNMKGFHTTAGDCTHADATTNQGTYGIMEGKPFVDRSIVSTDVAISVAKAILDDSASDLSILDIEFLRYVSSRIPGDWIRVIDRKKALDTTLRIKEIQREVDRNRIKMTFFNPQDDIAQKIAEIERNSDLNNVNGIGATNIYQVGPLIENFQNTFPTSMYVYIPTKAKIINDVRLNYKVLQYRADSTISASGASSTSGAGTSHQHTLLNGVWPGSSNIYLMGAEASGNKSYAGNGVDVNVTTFSESTTHTHLVSDHTHSQLFGIVQAAVTLPTVTISIGGVDRFTSLSGDQVDLDIASFMSTGWNTIIFTPNSGATPSGVGRIQADCMVQCYIESR